MLTLPLPIGDANLVTVALDVLLHHHRVGAFGHDRTCHDAYTLACVHGACESLASPGGAHHPQR